MTIADRIDKLIARKNAVLAERKRRKEEQEELLRKTWELAQELGHTLERLEDIPVFVEDNHNIVRCNYSKQASDHHQVWLTAQPSYYIVLFNIRADSVRGEPVILCEDSELTLEDAVALAVFRVENIFDTSLVA